MSRTALEKMYMAFVRPLLEYSDVVWDNCSLETKKQLDTIHVEAARIITGATKLCSTQLAFYVNLHRAVIGPSATLTGR